MVRKLGAPTAEDLHLGRHTAGNQQPGQPITPVIGHVTFSPYQKPLPPPGRALQDALDLTDPERCWEFKGIMPGQLCSKSNQRKIATWGGRPHLIKSDDARAYCKEFFQRFYQAGKPFEGDVILEATCYYQDRRRDLDIALLQDCLQTGTPRNPGANIIKNDRQVVAIHALRRIDRLNLRVEFTLTSVLPI